MKEFKVRLFLFPVLTIFLCVFFIKEKKNIGLFIDKTGLTKNTFNINIDNNLSHKDLFIYWLGETEYHEDINKVLIYHHKLQSDIPETYGKNRFLLKYKKIRFSKIGILKLNPYAKHKYTISLKLHNNNLIIDWNIRNWYDPDIFSGNDTIKITN